ENVTAEVGLLDKGLRPNRLHQFVLGHHLLVAADEGQEDLKSFRRQGDRLPGARHDPPLNVDAKWTKLVKFAAVSAHICRQCTPPRHHPLSWALILACRNFHAKLLVFWQLPGLREIIRSFQVVYKDFSAAFLAC